jgi:adenylate kinase family enzyme
VIGERQWEAFPSSSIRNPVRVYERWLAILPPFVMHACSSCLPQLISCSLGVSITSLSFVMPRIVLFGNAGSGKTTLARALSSQYGLAHLDLDSLAWDSPGVRRSPSESTSAIRNFIAQNSGWVIEGCYGDLLEQVLPYASEVRFLNPGVETCIANCKARPWEPQKYPSRRAQDQKLEFLLDWVRKYESRTDEYSLLRHRELFEGFPGPKVELLSLTER